jgi:hypothetical protein
MTDNKEVHISATTGRTIAFPPIQARDMIVEETNRRWVVENLSTTEKHRAVIRQELKLRELPKDDIAYAVPINADINAEYVERRERTRPMDLQVGGGLRPIGDRLVRP